MVRRSLLLMIKNILQKDMCVIADKSGVLGLGGIIGGTRSGTELDTKNILLNPLILFLLQSEKLQNFWPRN